MNQYSNVLIALLLCVVLAGCTHTVPILTVRDVPVPYGLTQEQQGKVIAQTVKKQGWYVVKKEPGVIVASKHYSEQYVEVNITYDAQSYSINYQKSHDMDADDGEISYVYTQWITQLNNAIKMQLIEAARIANEQKDQKLQSET